MGIHSSFFIRLALAMTLLGEVSRPAFAEKKDSPLLSRCAQYFAGLSRQTDASLTWQGLTLRPFAGKANFPIYQGVADDGRVVLIFKPEADTNSLLGEIHRWSPFLGREIMETRGYSKRAVAVSVVNRFFGFSVVPDTFVVDLGNERKAIAQSFLEGFREGRKLPSDELARISKEDVHQMVLLDKVLGMQDRHTRNWMVDAQGALRLIDSDHVLFKAEKPCHPSAFATCFWRRSCLTKRSISRSSVWRGSSWQS